MTDFQEDDKIAALPHHPAHIIKADCMQAYIKLNEGKKLVSPICRAEFKEEDIVWMVLKEYKEKKFKEIQEEKRIQKEKEEK